MGWKGERLWGWGPVLTGACMELRKGGKAEERNKSEGGMASNG